MHSMVDLLRFPSHCTPGSRVSILTPSRPIRCPTSTSTLAANTPRHNTHYVAGTSAKSSEGPVPLHVLANGALKVDFEDLALS